MGNSNPDVEHIAAIGLTVIAIVMVMTNGIWAAELKMIIAALAGFFVGRFSKE